MASQIEISLAAVRMLAGASTAEIEIWIDGEKRDSIKFGETSTLEVEAGPREIQPVLHGVATRKSRVLKLEAKEASKQ
ncbi:MAG: hypothetical protein AAGJ70_13845, partial [Pseudomonadota bacterium]